MNQPSAPRPSIRGTIVRRLRNADHAAGKYDRTRRLREVIGEHAPWWDWGHRLMALVGRDDGGNWGPPRARDLYWRVGWARRDDRTAIVGSENEYHETRDGWEAWQGVKRGEEWRTFDWQDDGHTLRVGWLGDDGRLHDSGVDGGRELARFRRWFIWDSWVKADWFGLRRWLYYKGLHQAVDHRIPFTCGLTPPQGTGGYSHWHCNVRRPLLAILRGQRQRHEMPHRIGNYTWVETAPGTPVERVEYQPVDNPRV